ncbi:MAG TPA: carbohydrate kinase [Solirubrobacteraceae bacterium]|jgi:fructokinase|nr:carbohydrate kinase [Solirubrobacteraceae bacterium]
MIVVAGEALVDLIPTQGGELGVNPGGGPFNTARWLGRLGADTAFLGTIAADPLGQRLRDELVATGVALDLVVATQLPTTLALAQLDAAGAAQYSFYTQGTSSGELSVEQVIDLLPDTLDALYVGGLGLVLEPIATALTQAVGLARSRGALVMVDPNIRAALIEDRAVYLAWFDAVLAQTDVLKLSVEDLAWLVPSEPAPVAARALLGRGPQVVILTAGADGATVLTVDGETTVPAVTVDVVDTIGAGDAFSAGFLVHWLRGGEGNAWPPRISFPAPVQHEAVVEAAVFAARAGALACSVRGATPPADSAARLQAAA